MKIVSLIANAILLASCTDASVAPPVESRAPELPLASSAPAAAPTAAVTPTSELRLYKKMRVFVASESTDQVWVLEAAPDGPYEPIAKIPVGRMPHQMAVSPDGRYVAVNNRMAASTSIIDPVSLKEIVRIGVGKQPHGITFAPDSKTVFVAHERENYIAAIDTATWKSTALMTGVPQHVLTMHPDRPNELWFTVTNSKAPDHLRVLDLTSKKTATVAVSDVHDAYFTPDGSEIWTTSSGFLDKPSDRMVVHDPITRKVKQEIRLPGRYPFHTLKPLQDGMYRLPESSLMVLTDHLGPALVWVDWRERRVVAETKLGQQPFHSTYDPEGQRILVTTNVDGMVNVIDLRTRQVVQKVPVTKAHGIVSVGLP